MFPEKENERRPSRRENAFQPPKRKGQYGGLWCLWLTWGLLLVLWGLSESGRVPHFPFVPACVVLLGLGGCGYVVITRKRGKPEMQLLKKKVQTEETRTQPVASKAPEGAVVQPAPGALRDVVVTAVHKDVFIAPGARLSGELDAEGNIVTEGCVEGNITSAHQVRVDSGGEVKGDIRAAHIIINGLVTGRCYAGVVTLLEQGRIEGDVFTEEFAIERGGIFIGQSSLPLAESAGKAARDGVKGVTRRDAMALEAALKSSGQKPSPEENEDGKSGEAKA